MRGWEVKKLCRKCDMPGWQESTLVFDFSCDQRTSVVDGALCGCWSAGMGLVSTQW